MFGDFPKIVSRDFFVGYLLPSVIFLASSFYLWKYYGRILISATEIIEARSNWLIMLITGVIIWIFAIFLLAANRSILRLKEGYILWNHPSSPLVRWQRRRFRRLQLSIQKLKIDVKSYKSKGKAPPENMLKKLIRQSWRAAIHFPHDEVWVLPTSFGNTIRAFEVYPQVMYGFDAISGWPLLQAVIPKDFRELIDSAKARLDFWVNMWFLLLLFLLEYIGLAIFVGKFKLVYCPVVAFVGILLTSFCARRSASHWGGLIKASFDIYLSELAKKLQLDMPSTREGQRKVWTSFSQAILYRVAEVLPDLASGQKCM